MPNLLNLIHRGVSPYYEAASFAHQYPHNKEGNDDQIGGVVIGEVLRDLPPEPVILEIGTWKGNSACYIARCCKEKSLKPEIVCIDTFCGSDYEWSSKEGYFERLCHAHGRPTLYEQFLANVIKDGHSDLIVPFPIDSLSAARFLYNNGVMADVIYLDSAYDGKSAIDNLNAYWKLLKVGGVMFGTYFPGAWPQFGISFNHFVEINEQQYSIVNNQFILRKKANPKKVYVCHVEAATERKERLERSFQTLGLTNIQWITGFEAGGLRHDHIPTSHLSIALKHTDAWSNITASKEDFALILEDDAIFPLQFIYHLETARQIIREQPKAIIFFNNFGHTTTVAYCLGQVAAKALIDNFGDIDKLCVPIDHKMAELVNTAGLIDLYLWPPVYQTSLEPPPHIYLDYMDVCKMPTLIGTN